MSKDLIGHHLLRVRIRKGIFDKMQDVAEEESARTGEHVTVSDLVRASCYNYLMLHESIARLENSPQDIGEEVLVIMSPML